MQALFAQQHVTLLSCYHPTVRKIVEHKPSIDTELLTCTRSSAAGSNALDCLDLAPLLCWDALTVVGPVDDCDASGSVHIMTSAAAIMTFRQGVIWSASGSC